MLYGIEEFGDEFGLIQKETLNLKKVIFVIVIIVLVIIVFSCFIISKISKNSNENIAEGGVENQQENVVNEENNEQLAQLPDEDNIQINKITSVNVNGVQEYSGTHKQIAEHNIELNILPVANSEGHKLIKDIYYSEEKQIYLTFDDGPSKDITPQILDILKENDVKATFFVLGARVDLYPETLKREFNEGHYIANHGYSHEYSRIYENRDTVFDEFNQCEVSIKNALGKQEYNSFLFRFPGGSRGGRYEKVKAEARQLLEEYGVAYTNWNCLTGDAAGNKTKDACIQEMLESKGDQNSIILLMHDANDKSQTVEALPEIIQYYKNEGYTFKNFYEIFK